MFIVLQYPIFDIRHFSSYAFEKLESPVWDYLSQEDVNTTFVRSTGTIKRRKLWGNSIGENFYASARKSIRFSHLPVLEYVDEYNLERRKKIKPVFRRLFFDGLACAKFEIGFRVDKLTARRLDFDKLKKFISNLLQCEVLVPVYYEDKVSTIILNAGRHLSRQYLRATTKNKYQSNDLAGVHSGLPCLYFERTTEIAGMPKKKSHS